MTASQLLAALLDAGTYRSWDSAPTGVRPAPGYAAELARARAATGLDESVCTGDGLLGGHRVAVAVSEFGFLGGSIGVAAAERLTLAVERATAERLPLIAAPASGGTRMQEGTVAFLQMVTITAAVAAHRAAGLPYLVYLRHPTTGGVFASWASVGPADPGRARRADRLPRPPGLPGPDRRPDARRGADGRKPPRPRPRRRRCPARRTGRLPIQGADDRCPTVSSRAGRFAHGGFRARSSAHHHRRHRAGHRRCAGRRIAWDARRGFPDLRLGIRSDHAPPRPPRRRRPDPGGRHRRRPAPRGRADPRARPRRRPPVRAGRARTATRCRMARTCCGRRNAACSWPLTCACRW